MDFFPVGGLAQTKNHRRISVADFASLQREECPRGQLQHSRRRLPFPQRYRLKRVDRTHCFTQNLQPAATVVGITLSEMLRWQRWL